MTEFAGAAEKFRACTRFGRCQSAFFFRHRRQPSDRYARAIHPPFLVHPKLSSIRDGVVPCACLALQIPVVRSARKTMVPLPVQERDSSLLRSTASRTACISIGRSQFGYYRGAQSSDSYRCTRPSIHSIFLCLQPCLGKPCSKRCCCPVHHH